IVEELGEQSRERLKGLGYDNVHVIVGDGYEGLEAEAPFDAVIVTAAAGRVPPPLVEQLKEGGRLIIPLGPPSVTQTLVLLEKRRGRIIEKKLEAVHFVPFTREKD
ncbi:MAG TPA: protein-L-isoaspartate O-methyltransferase, partial [Anseongella sp.]|nr:protein-L-isoaspartate O-methyltransferase [Anseongella sp.]